MVCCCVILTQSGLCRKNILTVSFSGLQSIGFYSQAVKTSLFHSGSLGSIPDGITHLKGLGTQAGTVGDEKPTVFAIFFDMISQIEHHDQVYMI